MNIYIYIYTIDICTHIIHTNSQCPPAIPPPKSRDHAQSHWRQEDGPWPQINTTTTTTNNDHTTTTTTNNVET